jgi:hypothetical protein
MLTPKEVENHATSLVDWSHTGKAAIVSVSQSPWLDSFNPYRLKQCKHFRIMFPGEFLDVICQDIKAERGCYLDNRATCDSPAANKVCDRQLFHHGGTEHTEFLMKFTSHAAAGSIVKNSVCSVPRW